MCLRLPALSPLQFVLFGCHVHFLKDAWRHLDSFDWQASQCHKNVFSLECSWHCGSFLKVALRVRGSASSAWHVGNEGFVVSFQQQAHRGRPRWWQMSADCTPQCPASTDTNKQLTDVIQYTTKQDWLHKVLHSKKLSYPGMLSAKVSFLYKRNEHVSHGDEKKFYFWE